MTSDLQRVARRFSGFTLVGDRIQNGKVTVADTQDGYEVSNGTTTVLRDTALEAMDLAAKWARAIAAGD